MPSAVSMINIAVPAATPKRGHELSIRRKWKLGGRSKDEKEGGRRDVLVETEEDLERVPGEAAPEEGAGAAEGN